MSTRRRLTTTGAALAAVLGVLAAPGTAQAAGGTPASGDATVQVTGRLERMVVDPRPGVAPGRGPATVDAVSVDGRLLDVPGGQVAGATPGQRVALTLRTRRPMHVADAVDAAAGMRAGRRTQDAVVVAAVPLAGSGRSAARTTVAGVHTLTILPVYWKAKDTATQPALAELGNRTHDYWSQQSGGAIDIRPTAMDWKQIADPGSCDSTALFNQAVAAFGMTPPVSPTDHVLVYFPTRTDCQWAGLGNVSGPRIWVNGYLNIDVFAHEFGHNLGLGHANTATCTSGSVRVPLSSACTVAGYADQADVMGYASWVDTGNLNAALADYLGLATVVPAATSGPTTVELAPLAEVSATRAVRIPLPSGDVVYVDFRPAAGRDVRVPDWAGVQVHLRTNTVPPTTQLLDLQPDEASPFRHANLAPNSVWQVPGTGLAVRIVTVGTTRATVSVVPTAGDATAPAAVTPTSPAPGQTVPVGATVTWAAATDAGTGVAAYAVVVDDTRRARLDAATTRFALPALATGSHTVRVDATDNAGNTATGRPVTFTVGTVAPGGPATVTAPAPGARVSGPVTVRWTLPAPAAAAVLVDGEARVTVAAGRTDVTLTGLADGPHTLAVRTLDAAGATVATSAPVTVTVQAVDRTPPSRPTVTAPVAGAVLGRSTATVTWTPATDAGSGVAGYRITAGGAVTSVPGTATSAQVTLPEGAVKIIVTAVDGAGLTTASTPVAVTVDTLRPDAPTKLALSADGRTLSWTAPRNTGSALAYRVTVDGKEAATVTTPTVRLALAAGRHRLTVTAVDRAGNASAAATLTATVAAASGRR